MSDPFPGRRELLSPAEKEPEPPRRPFLKLALNGLAALFGAVLGIPAVCYLIDFRNRKAPGGEFRTVARLGELPVGVPQQVVIRDVRTDAWTLHPSDEVGRVWIIRHPDNKLDVFTTICPHLGCSVNYEEKDKHFICPCHGGTFDVHGNLVKPDKGLRNPAPRGMDRLEYRVVPSGQVQVKYQNFRQGEPTAVPTT